MKFLRFYLKKKKKSLVCVSKISLAAVLNACSLLKRDSNTFSCSYSKSVRDCYFYKTILVAAFVVSFSIRK